MLCLPADSRVHEALGRHQPHLAHCLAENTSSALLPSTATGKAHLKASLRSIAEFIPSIYGQTLEATDPNLYVSHPACCSSITHIASVASPMSKQCEQPKIFLVRAHVADIKGEMQRKLQITDVLCSCFKLAMGTTKVD